MSKHKSKIISILLAILMVITLIPLSSTTAHAENNLAISGYTSGNDWDITASKGIDATVEKQTGEVQYIKIEVAQGMRLVSFPWNSAWGTVGAGVQGSPSAMSSQDSSLLSGNEVSVDAGGKTTLIYEVVRDAEVFNLSGKISVKPDELLSYNNDEILNAVTIEVLDSSKNTIESKSFDVNVTCQDGDGLNLFWWREEVATPGENNQFIGRFMIHKVYSGENYHSADATITKIVMPMPDGVNKIVNIEGRGSTTSGLSNYSFDATSKTLTVNDQIDMSGKAVAYNMYANIDSEVSTASPVTASEPSKFTVKYYDGHEETIDAAKTTYAYQAKSDDITLIEGVRIYKSQPQSGYPISLHETNSGGAFLVSKDYSEQEIAWAFDENTVDVVGVFFPVGKEGNVKVKSVTFDNGSTYSLDANNLGTVSGDLRYVTVSDLKNVITGVSSGAKYIRSITADCGVFDRGYYNGAVYEGFPVGYFSDYIVSNSTSNTLVPIKFIVNGNETIYNMPYSPKEIVGASINATVSQATVIAGNDFNVNVILSDNKRVSSIYEQHLYIVVPDNMTVNPRKITASYQGGTSGDITNKLKYSQTLVTDSFGERFNVIDIYAKDSVLSCFTDESIIGNSRISFNIPFAVSELSEIGTIDFYDYIFTGKGEIGSEFAINRNTESYLSVADKWDFDGDGSREETDILKARHVTINIVENKNIIVDGYLTQKGESGAVNAYDPGADGSSDVNAVAFSTGTEADYHVRVRSTLDTNNTPAEVDAYIPVPSAVINGSVITPKNTGGTASERYQFGDYKWPMTLANKITNPNSSVYSITYWLNEVSLDANGVPTETANTVKKTESQIAAADYANVVLVQISGRNIPMGSDSEFVLPLKVNISANQATQADVNGTKNIFRPYFHRKSDSGAGYNSGNYVAAKLTIGAIGGKVFIDKNGDSIYGMGDAFKAGVTVQLLKQNDAGTYVSTGLTTTTNASGDYLFQDLENGKYRVRVVNPDENTYHFGKRIADTAQNYQFNSDFAFSNHNAAVCNVELPYTASNFDKAQLFMNASLTEQIEVKIVNSAPAKGKVNGSSAANVETQKVFPNEELTEPTATANSGYLFGGWTIDGKAFTDFASGVPTACTITASWKEDKNNNGKADDEETFTVIFKDGNTTLKTVANKKVGDTIDAYTPTKENYVFDKWTPAFNNKVDASMANANGQIIYTASWKDDKNNNGKADDEETFTVIFKDGNTTLKTVANKKVGDTIDAYTPTKENYVFDKWTPAFNNKVDASMANKDGQIIYTASWKDDKNNNGKADDEETFTVIFKDGNTTLKTVANKKVGDTIDAYTPTKENYVFDKWTPAFSNKVDASMANANGQIIYTASWKDDKNNNGKADDEETFTVIFKDGDTELKKVESLAVGAEVGEYTPTKTDYLFDKWTPDFKNTVDASMANANSEIVYTAIWKEDKNNNGKPDEEETFTVIFKDGDTELKKTENLALGAVVEEYTPTKTDYVFDKWTPDFKNTVDASMADEDSVITYVATWKEDKNNNGKADDEEKFAVIFKDGNTELKKLENLSAGADVEEYTPTKKDYVFDKWAPEFVKTVDAAMANADSEIIYTASWKEDKNNNGKPDEDEVYKISYDLGGGTLNGKTGVIVEEHRYGEVITLPAPVRDGYTLAYWKGSEYQPGDTYTVAEDHTFTAIWKSNADAQTGNPTGNSTGDTTDNSAGGKNGVSRYASNVSTGDEGGSMIVWEILAAVAGALIVIAIVVKIRKRKGTL